MNVGVKISAKCRLQNEKEENQKGQVGMGESLHALTKKISHNNSRYVNNKLGAT